MAIKHFAAAVAGGVLWAGAAQAETEIVFGSWAPSSDSASVAMKPYVDAVAKASDGGITFETHFDGSVVQMRTVLNGIRDGLVDAGAVAGSIYRAELPVDYMLTNYATITSDPYAVSAASTQLMLNDCPECKAQIERFDIVPLAYTGTAPFYLMCKDPFSSIEELKGESIRASSAFLRWVDFLEATPVNTPTVEVLEVMQRGQVKCLVGSFLWLQTYSLWDAVTYVVDLPLGQVNNGLAFGINKGVWEDLSAEEQDILVNNLPILIDAAAHDAIARQEEVRRLAEEKGIVFAEPSEEYRKAFADFQARERDIIEKAAIEAGFKSAPSVLDKFEANVKSWNAQVKSIEWDREKYRELLEREIYSKL